MFAYGEDDNVWRWFRASIRSAYGSLNKVIDQFRMMIAQEVPDAQRSFLLQNLIRGAGIKGNDAQAVQARALAAPPQNAFDLYNLVTWASTHVLREPRAVVRAQRVATDFAAETEHRQICPVCHQLQH